MGGASSIAGARRSMIGAARGIANSSVSLEL